MALIYNKLDYNKILNFNVELAMTPMSGAKFLKFEADRALSWLSEKHKIKFVNYMKWGYLLPLSNQTVAINDKFYIYHNMGFNNVGHTEGPTQQIDNLKEFQELSFDDLGSNKYLSNQFRIEFSDLPALRALDLKAIWYLDAVYYPQEKSDKGTVVNSFLEYTRLSHGIGLTYSFSPMLSICLYYNIGNFNVRRGDDALTGGLSLTFCLL